MKILNFLLYEMSPPPGPKNWRRIIMISMLDLDGEVKSWTTVARSLKRETYACEVYCIKSKDFGEFFL